MLVAALTFGTAGWTIQPATDTATVRSVAGLSIDQFEKLQLPLLPLPGWEERARVAAISEWTASRQALLSGSQPHALLVASRDEAEQGRYFEGVDDSLLGFAELGLLPAPLYATRPLLITLRRVRTGYAYRPPALGTHRRHRAACPQGPTYLYVLGTRTGLGRPVRTAHRGNPGSARAAGRLAW